MNTDPLAHRAKAAEFLKEIFDCASESIQAALHKWNERDLSQYKPMLNPLTRACFVNSTARSIMRAKVKDVPGITIHDKKNTFFIRKGSYLVRIKKFKSTNLRSAKPRSSQARAFENQELCFPDNTLAVTLNVGFVPDQHWTSVLRIVATCPEGRRNFWSLPLANGDTGDGIINFPETQPNLPAGTERQRIKTPIEKKSS